MKSLKLKNKNQSQEMKDKTLYQKISTSAVTLLISEELNHDQLKSVDIRNEGFGLEWRDECPSGHLRVGDRALELNRMDVYKITNKDWDEAKHKLKDPVHAVFMRVKENREVGSSKTLEMKRMAELRSNICQIQQKLEQKLIESKNTSKELDLVIRERDSLGKENMRLLHRVAFLEDHTKELKIGMKQIQSSLERTLKTEGLARRGAGLRSQSHERCSTATSGVYSESDSSNSGDQSITTTISNPGKPWNTAHGEVKMQKISQDSFKRNVTACQKQMSRIPPPKPIRSNLHKPFANHAYSRSNSDGEQPTRNTKIPKPRILPSKKKAASYMNLQGKEAHILV